MKLKVIKLFNYAPAFDMLEIDFKIKSVFDGYYKQKFISKKFIKVNE